MSREKSISLLAFKMLFKNQSGREVSLVLGTVQDQRLEKTNSRLCSIDSGSSFGSIHAAVPSLSGKQVLTKL